MVKYLAIINEKHNIEQCVSWIGEPISESWTMIYESYGKIW